MNSEDLCIGEYKQSRRNNCRGAAFLSFIIPVAAVTICCILFLYYSAYYEPKQSDLITTLPPRTVLIKKYPEFYVEHIDINGDKYYEGVSGTTIMKIYIGNVTVKKKEKPELSRKR